MTAKANQAVDQTETMEPLEGQQMLLLGSNGDEAGGDEEMMRNRGTQQPESSNPTAQQIHRAVQALPRAEQSALTLACESYTKRDLKGPAKEAGFRSVKQHGTTLARAVRLIRMAIGFHGTVVELVDLLVAGRMAAALAEPDKPMGPGTSSAS